MGELSAVRFGGEIYEQVSMRVWNVIDNGNWRIETQDWKVGLKKSKRSVLGKARRNDEALRS